MLGIWSLLGLHVLVWVLARDIAYYLLSYLNVAVGLLGIYRLAHALRLPHLALIGFVPVQPLRQSCARVIMTAIPPSWVCSAP